MKTAVLVSISLVCILTGLSSFTRLARIQKCYINFSGTKNCLLSQAKRTTTSADSWIEFLTSKGRTKIYLKDSYEIKYLDSSSQPFAEIRLELTDTKTFKPLWLDRCKLHSEHHSTKGHTPVTYFTLNKNGYELFGSSAEVIDERPLLSIFYLFVNDKFLITFRFLNSDPSTRKFNEVKEFETKRDEFIEAYTKHILDCAK